ncbi:MAG: hypothetical protein LBQ22_02845 [Bacteroidales bacterium]|jgi:DNA polymerase-3 subunit epsilon|nr:hypothetical protein [Bacteroidales bacterium]
MSKLFSVVDIETNGGYNKSCKITEIAIFVTDGKQIISEFCSLVNPESYIPPFIENLTGISNEMVESAPKFYEIAKDIVEITKDTIFVAHNAGFDYGFIKQEFAGLGYDFKRDTLCTLKLSRKLFKGLGSYSLGNICKEFDIKLENRHRAFGDARATVDLFYRILRYDLEQFGGININGFSLTGINEQFDLTLLNNLPEKFGIFNFYNSDGEIIYIGKSKNIKSAILAFFRNEKHKKLRSCIVDIDYELTGCELISQLREAEEIAKNLPAYNKKNIKNTKKWGICFNEDEKGYIRFFVQNIENSVSGILALYSTKKESEDILMKYCVEYNLCRKLCGLYTCAGACFYYGLGECKGACCGEEPVNEYNSRAEKLINKFNSGLKNAYIFIHNCDNFKIGIVSVKSSEYVGFGFLDSNTDFRLEDVEDMICKQNFSKETSLIIHNYLAANNNYKIIHY